MLRQADTAKNQVQFSIPLEEQWSDFSSALYQILVRYLLRKGLIF